METGPHGWTLLSSLVLPTLICLPDLSRAAARRWVTRAGEALGSVKDLRSRRDLGLTTHREHHLTVNRGGSLVFRMGDERTQVRWCP